MKRNLTWLCINLIANVPAMADHLAKKPGWPTLMKKTKFNMEALSETTPYFDMVNFAPQIKAKTLIGVGLRDSICVPESVWAIYNNIKGVKKSIVSPQGCHTWNPEMTKGVSETVDQWLNK